MNVKTLDVQFGYYSVREIAPGRAGQLAMAAKRDRHSFQSFSTML